MAAGYARRERGPLERELRWADTRATTAFGEHLGRLLRGGDVVVLTGALGAGKTTLTQAIATGLGVRGPITSPTFVIARVHPSLGSGPDLVHVDAYRLGNALELDDLDLDADLEHSVTVVEWGAGLVEQLSDERLEIILNSDDDSDRRTARVVAVGRRFDAVVSALGELDR